MNKTNFVCDICGETITGLEEYVTHVKACGAKEKAKIKAEQDKKYLEIVNAAINKVKAAKEYYEACLEEFKEKYPKEYELNFSKSTMSTDTTSNDTCNKKVVGEDEFFGFLKEILGF